MSKAKGAVNSAAAKMAKELPKVIALSDAEQISLAVLVEKLAPLLQLQGRILAKIENDNGLEVGVLATQYQLANGELVKIIG